MDRSLTTHLSREEFTSLQEVGKGLLQRVIPLEHEASLIELLLIKRGLGGLGLTDAGKMRIAAGR
jgi:hypothetical protein